MAGPVNSKLSLDHPVHSEEILSPLAQGFLKDKVRFTGYPDSEKWTSLWPDVEDALRPDSNDASDELLSDTNWIKIADHDVIELVPNSYKKAEEENIILYFHGGAYILGDPDWQKQIPAPISNGTGWKVYAVKYPLALESNYDGKKYPALECCFQVYLELLKTYDHSRIAILGDSAGGGLAAGVALKLLAEGLDLPGSLVLYAPWIDMEQNTESYSNPDVFDQTATLTRECLQSARDLAFGNDSNNYSHRYVSPINATDEELRGLPPVAIFTAGRDLLRREGELFEEKLQEAGVKTKYHCGEGLWHNYQEHYHLPESKKCADLAVDFLKQHMER